MLVAKKCPKCNAPMHIHQQHKDAEIIFAGCEPCLINLTIKKIDDNEVELTAQRSTKRIRCSSCTKVSVISTFEEVKDGDGSNSTEEDPK